MPFSSDPFPGRGPRFQLLFADHRGRAPTRFEQLLDRHVALEAEGDQRWSKVPAGLEEAFIYLMAGARDNFSRDAA